MAVQTGGAGPDEEPGGQGTPGQEAPSAAGDLQFDEAWADSSAPDDAWPDRAPRTEAPAFEDPNDR